MEKNSSKIFYAISIVVLVFLTFVIAKQMRNDKNKIASFRLSIQEMSEKVKYDEKFVGKKLFIDAMFRDYRSGSMYDAQKFKKHFSIVLVLGKINCQPCIGDFIKYLTEIPQKNIDCAVVVCSDDRAMLQTITYESNHIFPVFYTDKLDWFEKYDVVTGPAIFIVERDTQKIVAFYKKTEHDRWGFEERIKNTILKFASDE